MTNPADFLWVFVEKLVVSPDGRSADAAIKIHPQQLKMIDPDWTGDHLPEGFLIECAAQCSGLSWAFKQAELKQLPVLARVNSAEFLDSAPINEKIQVRTRQRHTSELGLEFDCQLQNGESRTLMDCRLTLGLMPVAGLSDGGGSLLSHYERLREKLRIS